MPRTQHDNSPLTPMIAGFVLFATILVAPWVIAFPKRGLPEPPAWPTSDFNAEWRTGPQAPSFDGMIRTRSEDRIANMIRE